MGTLMDEDPPYRMTFRKQGAPHADTVGRGEMRTRVEGLRKEIVAGTITDMKVINRFDVDVTVDWFG